MNRLFFIVFVFLSLFGYSQDTTSYKYARSEKILYQEAKDLAYDKKRAEARVILRVIIERDSTFYPAHLLIARTYSWDKRFVDARKALIPCFQLKKNDKSAWLVRLSIEKWDKKYDDLMAFSTQALSLFPNDAEILLLNTQNYIRIEDYEKASELLLTLLELEPDNEEAQVLYSQIKLKLSNKYIINRVSYQYFTNPKYPRFEYSLGYKVKLKKTTVILRSNYSNRFSKNAVQVESDVYAKLFKGNYTYFNLGYGVGSLYPIIRFGLEPYFKLPHKLEASIGTRLLKFNTSMVDLYTMSIGHYYRNYWFSARTFITPKDQGISKSVSLAVRKYYSSAKNFIELRVGYGVSPDQNYFINEGNQLLFYETYNTSFSLIKELGKRLQLRSSIGGEYFNKNQSWLLNINGSFTYLL